MTGEYVARLVCLCLASFFFIHTAAGLAASLAYPCLSRTARLLPPRLAARLLLILRWTPAGLAVFAVGALCIPSYLWLEPGETGEEPGLFCLAGACLGFAVCLAALVRGSRQVLRSRRCLREFPRLPGPVVAIAGVLRPRLLISPVVMDALSAEQLDAALRHERAHGAAQDNLKRLLLAFTPGLLPGAHGFAGLERQWARFTEWAADDEAVAGDAERGLALASALVHVARLSAIPVPLASSMIEGDGLAERVHRLLAPAVPAYPRKGSRFARWAAWTAVAALVAMALRPATLASAHSLLERLFN